MNTATESIVEEKEILTISKELPVIIQEAENFKIANDLDFAEATERAIGFQTKLKKVLEFFKPMKEAASAAHKAVCSRENEVAPFLKKAKEIYTDKAASYQKKKQDEQAEKERKALAEAEAKETKRKKEIQDKIDEENRKAEEARKKGDADALAIAESNKEILEEKKETVYVAPRPVAQAPRATGFSVQTVWEAEVVDQDKVPAKWFKEVDIARLKRAKTDDKTLEVPGIRFAQKAQGSARGVK